MDRRLRKLWNTIFRWSRSEFYLSLWACLMALDGYGQTPSGPLTYTGASNIFIQNKVFTTGTGGACITLTNCTNVTIKNCVFDSIPGFIGVQVNSCTNVEVYKCTFYYFKSGVYSVNSKGINVHCNSFKNIVGPKPRGQIVQLNKNSGTGNRINYNILDHTLGQGNPEDLINIYQYNGEASDPLQIIGNKLRGGGPSPSGGGIMVGDNGGDNIRVENNILVNPGQYGIAAPSGENILFKNNQVYSKSMPFTNVGLYVGLSSEIAAGFSCNGPTITATGNRVNWRNRTGINNSFYNCPCCPSIRNVGNVANAPIDSTILPKVLTLDPINCLMPLPIQALELKAITEENGTRLLWNFDVEESVESISLNYMPLGDTNWNVEEVGFVKQGMGYVVDHLLSKGFRGKVKLMAKTNGGEEISSNVLSIKDNRLSPQCSASEQQIEIKNLDQANPGQIQIVDGKGQQKLFSEIEKSDEITFDISSFTSGIYILHYQTNFESFACKWMK